MKKIRKHTQLSLLNRNGAGRPAKVDIGIRHIRRERINKPSALHLTIKVRENKADIQNKRILKALHHAIKRARLQRLRVIHYTLEYNHAHLVVEAGDNKVLHKGMQAFGISIAKAINKMKQVKGTVYKHRYHLRKLKTRREVKNAIQYVFGNGIKHKRAMSKIDLYNSLPAEKRISADIQKIIEKSPALFKLKEDLRDVLDEMRVFYLNAYYLWN
jgi:hypothetical protein